MKRVVIGWVSILCLVLAGFAAEGAVRSEYEVKAGFLYNFARFVEWPTENTEVFYLCILGVDPFGPVIDAIEKRDVRGRHVKVIRQQVFQPGMQCDLVFISDSERNTLPQLLADLARQPILTISDIEGFAEQGGMIELAQNEKRIQFLINHSAARAAGLRVSAKLLELARTVF